MGWAPVGLCVPKTLSTLCDQAIFVDHATDASLPSDAVVLKGDAPPARFTLNDSNCTT